MEGLNTAPQPRPTVPAGNGGFWKWLAAAVVLLLSGVVCVQVAEHSRQWRVEDEAAERARQAEQARLDADSEKQSELFQAEVAKKRRVTLATEENKKHPERFKEFSPRDQVRVLSTSPDASQRGLRALIMFQQGVTDAQSGVEWKRVCGLTILPLLTSGSALSFEPVYVDAEHLVTVGSAAEQEDLQRNPGLREVAARQEERIAAADRRMKEMAELARIQEGDPVVIAQDDPRPALRGLRGQVVRVLEVDLGNLSRVEPPDREVLLDPTLKGPMGVVRVKIAHLRPAPR